MKYKIIFLSLLLIGCANHMVEFKPVTKKGDTYIIVESQKDVSFVKRLKYVFDFYDVTYEEKSDTIIFIDEKLYADMDLMYNYTKKANDEEWLKTH